jgi:hypothetical protein
LTLYETDYRIVCVIAFIERSRLGKTIYELSADRLKVSGKRFLQKYAMDVELRDVSSNIDRLSQRVYRPAIFLFGIGSLQAVVAVGLCFQKALIAEAVVLPVEFLGLSSVCAFIAGSRWISRLEVAKFKSTLGAPLFFLIKEKSYADEFEAFIDKLQETIRRSKEPGRISQPTAADQPSAAQKSQEHLWKFSVALGIFAVGQPWFKPLAQLLYDCQIIVTGVCCMGGLVYCVFSFLKKERFRYLSLLGAILSFIPPLFY